MSDVSFNGPESLGGKVSQIEPAPVAVSWHVAGRLDVFATDASSSTLQHWWFDGGWGGPESLGGNVVAPSAVSWAANRLDVFAIDNSSSTLQHWSFNGGWGVGPDSWGGNLSLASALSAVSWASGRLDVFGIDANSSTLQHWWGKPFPIQ